MGDIEVADQLPDPVTGELHPAVPRNAARIRLLAGDVITRMRDLQHACDVVLADEAQRQGTKTLHLDGYDVTLTGGVSVEYDPHELMVGLMEAGCPPDRVNQAVVETVSYKVNRAVLRQLAGANDEYRQAIDNAKQEVEKPWRATVR